jgi:hypothetical protein
MTTTVGRGTVGFIRPFLIRPWEVPYRFHKNLGVALPRNYEVSQSCPILFYWICTVDLVVPVV